MTSVSELLADLERAGISLWLDGDRLLYTAPPGGIPADMFERLKHHKPGIVDHLRASRSRAARPQRLQEPDAVPISWNQEPLWRLEAALPGNAFSNQISGLLAVGELDVPVLRRAFDEIVRRHEALRTAFADTGAGAMQIVSPAAPCPFVVEDVPGPTDDTRTRALSERLVDERLRPLDLAAGEPYRVMVFRLDAERHVIVQIVHHLVWDGWSRRLVHRELASLYSAFVEQREPGLSPPRLQYRDFARWQRAESDRDAFAGETAYWRRTLAGAGASSPSSLQVRQAASPMSWQRASAPAWAADGLRRIASACQCTPMTAVLSAFFVWLSELSGSTDVATATLVGLRPSRDLEDVVGVFVNTLPLRVDLAGDPPFTDVLARVQCVVADAFAHSSVPFEIVLNALDADAVVDRGRLLPAMFLYHPDENEVHALPGVTLHALDFKDLESTKQIPTSFDLVLTVRDRPDGFVVSLAHKTAVMDSAVAAAATTRFTALLQTLASSPDRTLSQLTRG